MSQPLRVCFVTPEYPPGLTGGIGTSVQLLARGLVRAGHQARVVGVFPQREGTPDRADDEGVQIWRLWEHRWRGSWVWSRFQLWRTIARWAAAGEIDLVEIPDWQGIAAGWPALPVPVVVRCHGTATYFALECRRGVDPLTYRLERASLLRADYRASVSRYTAIRTATALALAAPIPTVLPNAVDVGADPPGGDRDPASVVFSGTLTAKKGVLPLADAWRRVVAVRPDAELHVFGKDSLDENGRSMRSVMIERLGGAASRVKFHGHVPRPLILAALRRARLAVFPSYAEAFAMGPLEAMAEGCPTIYSRRGSGRELIEHGRDGLLVDPDDSAETTAAILRVLADDPLASQLGRGGHRRVLESFGVDQLRERNVEFFRACVEDFAARAAALGRRPAQRRRSATPPQATAAPAPPAQTGPSPSPVAGAVVTTLTVEGRPAPRPTIDDLTVVVCTCHRAPELARFLESLAAEAAAPAQLIIVDASLDDATEAIVRERLPEQGPVNARYMRVAGHLRGLTRQRNLALAHVRTPLVAFFDDDIVLRPGCLQALADAHRAEGEHVVGVGAFIENEVQRPSLLWRLRFWLGMISTLRPGRYCRSGISTPWGFLTWAGDTIEGDWLPGCAMSWKTGLAREVGFNEAFEGYASGEDLDFAVRMGRFGRLLVTRAARVLHLHAPAGRPNPYDVGYLAMRNHYATHRALPERTWRDTVWFLYAHGLDTLVRSSSLLRPGRRRQAWAFLRGRVRFFMELPGSRPTGPETATMSGSRPRPAARSAVAR